jgi:hypothetical protein
VSFEASIHSADQQIIRSAEHYAKKGFSAIIFSFDGDYFFQCAHLEHVYVAAQGRGRYAGGWEEPWVIYPYKAMRDLGVVVARGRPAYEGPLRCALLMTIAGTDWVKHGFPGLGLETGWKLLQSNPALHSPAQVRAAAGALPAVRCLRTPVGGRLSLALA